MGTRNYLLGTKNYRFLSNYSFQIKTKKVKLKQHRLHFRRNKTQELKITDFKAIIYFKLKQSKSSLKNTDFLLEEIRTQKYLLGTTSYSF